MSSFHPRLNPRFALLFEWPHHKLSARLFVLPPQFEDWSHAGESETLQSDYYLEFVPIWVRSLHDSTTGWSFKLISRHNYITILLCVIGLV